MNRSKVPCWITFALMAGTSIGHAAELTVLSEIVVTATKRPIRVQDAGMSLEVLQGGDLEALGALSFSDFVASVPSLDFNTTIPGQNRLTIRGVSALEGVSTIGMYVDETPVTSNQESQIDAVLYDLERIEILRGPQGTLYGEGSVGGTIRFISNKPDADKLQAKGRFILSSTKNGGENYSANAMVNLPVVKDKVALRLVGTTRHDAGFVDNLAIGEKDSNETDIDGVRGTLRIMPTEDVTIDLSVIANRMDSTGAPLISDGLTNSRPLNEAAKDDFDIYSLTLSWDLPGVTLTSSSSYFDREQESVVYLPAFGGLGNITSTDYEAFTQEIRLTSATDSAFEWLIGGFYKDADTKINNPINFLVGLEPTGPLVVFSDTDQSVKQVAVFGEIAYKFTEKLKATAGLRYYHEKNSTDVLLEGPVLGIPTLAQIVEKKLSVVTPRVALTYKVTDDLSTYASVSQGFRAGGVNANPLSPPGSPLTYNDDNVISYELGVTGNMNDGLISVNGAVFYNDFSDYQADIAPQIIGGGTIANVGSAHSLGVEASFIVRPVEGLELRAAGNLVEAELDDDVAGVGVKGARLPLVPKHTLSFSGQYQFPVFDGYTATIRAEHNIVGKSYETLANMIENPSYNLTNARLGIENEVVGVTLFADNLFDHQASYRNLGEPLGFFTNPPRTIGAMLNISY